MKFYKKYLIGIIASVIVLTMLCGLTGCGRSILDNEITDTVKNAVTYPEQYSITYQVEETTGIVRIVTKTVDADGNVYFISGEKEKLYIKDGDLYELYERDSNGEFRAMGMQAAYNQTHIDSETAEFADYAEQSKKQFIPGMESTGEEEVLGRTCLIYGVKIGGDNTGVSYSFYVDQKTGICLGFESKKSAGGFDLGADGEVFTCTEFITEDVPSLSELITAEALN